MGGVLTSLRVMLMRFVPWFNKPRLLKSKSGNNHGHHNNNDELPLLSCLPNDVVVNILSKLDIVTLCRCVAASSQFFSPLLSQIQSLSTPLPSSLILNDKNSWHGRLADYVLDKITLQYHNLVWWLPKTLIDRVYEFAWFHLRRIQNPRFSKPGRQFFQRLTGLESLELEFPTPDYLHYPNMWFRWLSKYEIESRREFFVSINATIVPLKQQIVGDEIISHHNLDRPAIQRRLHDIMDRFIFHLNAGCPYPIGLKNWPRRLHTMVTKDAHNNGRKFYFRTESSSSLNGDEPKIRQIICYMPSTLVLNNESLHVKDAFVWFWYHSDNIDQGATAHEFILTCLGNTRDYEERELREAVQKALENDNLIVIQDDVGYGVEV